MSLPSPTPFIVPSETVRMGRHIVLQEAQALQQLADRLSGSFDAAVDLLMQCRGCAIVTGMGKAGLVGRKIAATLASTGTPSHFVHPAEALHGDLGSIRADDVVLAFSNSGETDEVLRLSREVAARRVTVIGITSRPGSSLATIADTTIDMGPMDEAGELKLAPSTTSTAMLALGDALALVVSRRRGFQAEDFARHHPGGSLGNKLGPVEDFMRKLSQCRVAVETQITRDVLVQAGQQGRRTGAIMLTNLEGALSGIFTDSDLARLVERRQETALDQPIAKVMTANPTKVLAGTRLADAIETMVTRKISELPVTDAEDRPIGIIDVTDVISLFPPEEQDESSADFLENDLVSVPFTRRS